MLLQVSRAFIAVPLREGHVHHTWFSICADGGRSLGRIFAGSSQDVLASDARGAKERHQRALKGLQSKERRRGHTLVDPFEGRLLPKRLSCSSGVRKPG